MNDIVEIIKSLENSYVLIEGVTETVKHEIKKIRSRISWCFVSFFRCFSGTAFSFVSTKGIAGRGVRGAGRGYMNENVTFCSNFCSIRNMKITKHFS